jgi:hypothetical protein
MHVKTRRDEALTTAYMSACLQDLREARSQLDEAKETVTRWLRGFGYKVTEVNNPGVAFNLAVVAGDGIQFHVGQTNAHIELLHVILVSEFPTEDAEKFEFYSDEDQRAFLSDVSLWLIDQGLDFKGVVAPLRSIRLELPLGLEGLTQFELHRSIRLILGARVRVSHMLSRLFNEPPVDRFVDRPGVN